MMTDPLLVFESIVLDVYSSGLLEVPKKFFKDFQNVHFHGEEASGHSLCKNLEQKSLKLR